MNDITYFACANYRNQNKSFGIHQADRLLHTYLLGKTGTGKSTCLRTMLLQDIEVGRGCCLLDPHGDLFAAILAAVPQNRQSDVISFDLTNRTLNLRYNPLKSVSQEKRSLVASGVLEVFAKLWSDAWGVKLEHILRNCILTLLDQPTAFISDIPKLLLDRSFRTQAIPHVTNPSVADFWRKEFPAYNRYDLLPVLNKVGGMLAHPVIQRVLISNPQEVSLRKAMDEGKIILVNLSKGHLGEDAAKILGALFVTSISSAAFSRADTEEHLRRPFMLFLDEFHTFSTLSLISMFSELRKFKVGLILAHQYLGQLDPKVKQAILGNAGTIICFRLGAEDAHIMSREIQEFKSEDFVCLPNFHIYLKLMIDGVPSKGFSATVNYN